MVETTESCLQGRVKFPTGGKVRERKAIVAERRIGVIPIPTVKSG